ncbi:hypothetical protein KUCAC02_036736, partial [Chaenocephalus aceratus]
VSVAMDEPEARLPTPAILESGCVLCSDWISSLRTETSAQGFRRNHRITTRSTVLEEPQTNSAQPSVFSRSSLRFNRWVQ